MYISGTTGYLVMSFAVIGEAKDLFKISDGMIM